MYFGAESILTAMNIRPDLMNYGKEYLGLVGGFLFLQAVLMTITGVVRNHGYTKISMYVTLTMNIIHVILDYAFIFGPFGIPVLGVKGVAISTNICKLLALIAMIYILVTKVEKNLTIKYLTPFPKDILRDLLKIGIPTAGEQLSYNVSQIAVTYFINMLSNEALTTKAYVQNIVMFAFLFAVAIGQGTEILIGHLVGENKKELAYKTCLKSLRIAIITSLAMASIFAVFRTQLLSIFTDNNAIIAIGGTILIIDIILEPGRAFNLVVINSLRAAGDVRFPVYMGILSMWGVSVVLSYILGIHFGFGLVGMWIAFALDEWIRGLLMLWRWRGRKWENMSFVTAETA
jgi:putative MATE family efflux protein